MLATTGAFRELTNQQGPAMRTSTLRSIVLIAGFAVSFVATRVGPGSFISWLPTLFPFLAALVVLFELKAGTRDDRFMSGNRFLAIMLLISPAAMWLYPSELGFSPWRLRGVWLWWVASAAVILLIGSSLRFRASIQKNPD